MRTRACACTNRPTPASRKTHRNEAKIARKGGAYRESHLSITNRLQGGHPLPFRNARLHTGTLPDSVRPGPRYKIYLTGLSQRTGVHSWSQIFRHPEMSKSVKPTKDFATRADALRNALEVFPDEASFQRFAASAQSKGGKPLDDAMREQLNLEVVSWVPEVEAASSELPTLFDHDRNVKAYERKMRPNQDVFSESVFARYGERCALCRISSRTLLEAAHIVAWAAGGRDVPENGLVLCCLHHRALDAGMIRIDPDTLLLHPRKGSFLIDLFVEETDLIRLTPRPRIDALRWLWLKTST